MPRLDTLENGPNLPPESPWVELRRDSFGKGTFGKLFFPEDVLIGKFRPWATYDQSLLSLWGPYPARALKELHEARMSTVREVIESPMKELLALRGFPEILHHILKFWYAQSITPQARIIGVVFNEDQTAISSKDEPDLINAVDSVLEGIHETQKNILSLLYGRRDGITRTLVEVGFIYNRSPQNIRRIENEAIKRLLQEPASGILQKYRTCPEPKNALWESVTRTLSGNW